MTTSEKDTQNERGTVIVSGSLCEFNEMDVNRSEGTTNNNNMRMSLTLISF